MNPIGQDTILATFVIFCRIGGCLMLMPGFSSTRVPVQIRLFVAIAVTLALSPLLIETIRPIATDASPSTMLHLIVTETFMGSLIGLLGRTFYMALQFMAMAIASYISFSVLPGVPVEEAEPMPAIVSLITMSATTLFFITDQHWELFGALTESYAAWPPGAAFNLQPGLIQLADRLYEAFMLSLRVSGPFLVYGITINLAIGLINKLTPQIPIYFISLPFTIAGGLVLLYVMGGEFLRFFTEGFASWLQSK